MNVTIDLYKKSAIPILMDAGYPKDKYSQKSFRQIKRAVNDLRQDLSMVVGGIAPKEVQQSFLINQELTEERLRLAPAHTVPQLFFGRGQENIPQAVIIGSVQDSSLIKEMIQRGKLPEAQEIKEKTEAFFLTVVKEPLPGIEKALVIAGTDTRGTIYGIYTLSEIIGVSPWYWFSDTAIKRQTELSFEERTIIENGPSVPYRGIFINDEERTIDWAKLKFPTDNGTPDVNYYRHVFELLLRLRMNVFWPAMHEGTTAFNHALDESGIPINAKAADEYGIIMSASHCEMLLRNNVGEWEEWFLEHQQEFDWQGDDYRQAFDYTRHKEAILQYWEERLQTNKDFESILALGIRGVHDGVYATANLADTFGTDIDMMKDVIYQQRKMIERVYGDVDAVPQVFIPYKEMGNLYNDGLKAFIPDNVMLMWAEDNFGYLRQVPNHAERARSGGSGIYYHNSYWGHPKSYLWLNSIQLSLMIEELHKAYDTGAGKYWILNVGDLKPGEIAMDCFAQMAWDIQAVTDESIEKVILPAMMKRNFHLSDAQAAELASIVAGYSRLCGIKRAEAFGTENPSTMQSAGFRETNAFPFSVTSAGDEGMRYLHQCHQLQDRLQQLQLEVSEEDHSGLYQQIGHLLDSYTGMAEQFIYYWKYRLAVQQGRYGSRQYYQNLSNRGQQRILEAQQRYWEQSGGKWQKAIGFSHPISYYGGVNEGAVMLTEHHFADTLSPGQGIGACCENNQVADRGILRFNRQMDNSSFVDVFSRSGQMESWYLTGPSWLEISLDSGTTDTEQRVSLSVQWDQVSSDVSREITIYDGKTDEIAAIFTVMLEDRVVSLDKNCYCEANGYVYLEAENYTEAIEGKDGSYWQLVENIGQSGDCMKAMPDLAEKVITNFSDSAKLRYRMYFWSTGSFKGTLFRLPTLNEGYDDDGRIRTCDLAIGIDDEVPETPQLVGNPHWGGQRWDDGVMRLCEPLSFDMTIKQPGWHTLTLYRSDPSLVVDRIIIETQPGAVGDPLIKPADTPYNK